MRSRSWSSVFMSTSYTKSFVWAQKVKNQKRLNRGRHCIGTSQNQPRINADVAPQKYNGTEGILQENARRMVALPVLNYQVIRHRVNANRCILVL
jgi:hypothetical protein